MSLFLFFLKVKIVIYRLVLWLFQIILKLNAFMQFLTFQFLKLLKHEIKSKLFYTKQTCIKPSYIHPASEYSNNTQWAGQGVIWHNWITLLMVNMREVSLQFLCSLHLSSGSIRVVNIYWRLFVLYCLIRDFKLCHMIALCVLFCFSFLPQWWVSAKIVREMLFRPSNTLFVISHLRRIKQCIRKKINDKVFLFWLFIKLLTLITAYQFSGWIQKIWCRATPLICRRLELGN